MWYVLKNGCIKNLSYLQAADMTLLFLLVEKKEAPDGEFYPGFTSAVMCTLHVACYITKHTVLLSCIVLEYKAHSSLQSKSSMAILILVILRQWYHPRRYNRFHMKHSEQLVVNMKLKLKIFIFCIFAVNCFACFFVSKLEAHQKSRWHKAWDSCHAAMCLLQSVNMRAKLKTMTSSTFNITIPKSSSSDQKPIYLRIVNLFFCEGKYLLSFVFRLVKDEYWCMV